VKEEFARVLYFGDKSSRATVLVLLLPFLKRKKTDTVTVTVSPTSY
jgi:hypothetical protein